MAKQQPEQDKCVIYCIKYQSPKFGTENEFLPEVHTFIVSTNRGMDDAKAALQQYHPGSRLVVIMDPTMTKVDDADGSITKKALAKLEAKK